MEIRTLNGDKDDDDEHGERMLIKQIYTYVHKFKRHGMVAKEKQDYASEI